MNFMKFSLINLFLFSTLFCSNIPDINSQKWIKIQKDFIDLDYIWKDGLPWCKSKINLNYSVEEILNVIKNVGAYNLIFDSVVKSKEYKNNIVHITLDLPGIFSDRDYVVKFNLLEDKQNKTIIYEFKSISDFIEINQNYVRLLNAGGQWRLKSLADNLTEVTYIWNGDMSGNFPSWGLKRAWIKQGNEVLSNLKEAVMNNGDS
tara:strand:+ start:307 stop:918 length:612 start_codon:yes stop_codon:yes gene_type:complete